MSNYRGSKMGFNDIYKDMLTESKQTHLTEAVTSNNSIHSDVETYMNEFSSTLKTEINVEELEEKLRDLEKNELTSLDKKIISQIRKVATALGKPITDFDNFKKNLKFEYVVTKKGQNKEENEEETELPEDGVEPDETAIPTDEYEELPQEELKQESKQLKAADIYKLLG